MRALALTSFALMLAVASAAGSYSWNDAEGRSATGTVNPTGSGWPACDPGVTQHSGYFDIDAATNKHYFFWMFEAKKNPSTAPTILWMTGGPGCSSGLAILAENGPCHVNETTGALYNNPHSWNNVANVIYIDQPAGVGFSYGDKSGYDHNETQVGDDMYAFMQAFYAAYPQYKSNPLFVYGESYGGHYAPAVAHRIWQGNNAGVQPKLPLAGLSVGNGMTQPQTQLQWYGPLAYQWCKTVKGVPCISEADYQAQMAAVPQCVELIKQCNNKTLETAVCGTAMNDCLNTQFGPFENSGLNVYDIRIPCKVPGLCYNFSQATAFMNRADVQTSLGVRAQNITWQSCNMQVNGMFGLDWMRNFDQYVKDLINDEIRVLVYSGDVDFICNWLGNKAWTLGLEWNQKAAFNAQQDYPWWIAEKPAGRVRTVSGSKNTNLFTFLQIHEAGHMVPMNQPQAALAMVEKFVFDEAFFKFDGPM